MGSKQDVPALCYPGSQFGAGVTDGCDRTAAGTTEKRSPLWIFEGLDIMRRKFIQRAGRLTRTNGTVTLTMSANAAVEHLLQHYLAT